MRLPQGYVEHDQGSLRVIAPRLELDEMVGLLTGPVRDLGRAGEARTETALGRGGTRRFVLPGGKAVYVRKYLRGGFVRHFARDRYLRRPPRPIRELVITEHARAAGCPVPTVLAACVEEAGLFYRGWLVTAAIEPAVTLFRALDEAVDEQATVVLLEAAGRSARVLHAAGIYHPDLTGDNMLVRDDGSVSVVDLDRAFVGRPDSARLAGRGLDRLWRSLVKGQAFDTADQRRWLELGYRG